MKRKSIGFAAALAASLAFTAPALSQVPDYDGIAVACSTGAECEILVTAAIDQLRGGGFAGDAFHEQLGLLAGALAEGADGVALTNRFAIARGLRVIAQASADTQQTGSIFTLADRLERGTGRNNAPVSPFGSASEA